MDFTAHDLRVGTVVEASLEARALRLTVDFGGTRRTTTAHITERYAPEGLVGTQVVAVLDRDSRATCVVLAAVSATEGAVLVRPEEPVPDGTRVV